MSLNHTLELEARQRSDNAEEREGETESDEEVRPPSQYSGVVAEWEGGRAGS